MSKRKNEKHIKLNDDELRIILERSKKLNLRVGTYMRLIAVKGEIKEYDMKLVNDVRMEIHRIGVNINQIAQMINRTGQVYENDIKAVKHEFNELKNMIENWLKPLDD